MKVLVIGSGGREHAIAWQCAQFDEVEHVFVAPGNAGTAQVGTNVEIGVNEFEKIKELCISEEINMLIVGPEDP